MLNKHAQFLGRLSGRKKTKEEMQILAKARWANTSKKDKEKHRQKCSDGMRKYWIGWREVKERKEKEIKNSVKKSFDNN